jgi:hypothetical protein
MIFKFKFNIETYYYIIIYEQIQILLACGNLTIFPVYSIILVINRSIHKYMILNQICLLTKALQFSLEQMNITFKSNLQNLLSIEEHHY